MRSPLKSLTIEAMEAVFKIVTAPMWDHHLHDRRETLYETRERANAELAELERRAKNAGAPQVTFQVREIDLASEAARALGARGGAVKSEAKAEASRENGKKRGRPRKAEKEN